MYNEHNSTISKHKENLDKLIRHLNQFVISSLGKSLTETLLHINLI